MLEIVGSPKAMKRGEPAQPTQPNPASWSASCVNDEPTYWTVKTPNPSSVLNTGCV
jgi:hypothetical protein